MYSKKASSLLKISLSVAILILTFGLSASYAEFYVIAVGGKVSCRDVDWNCTPGVGNSCSFDKDSCCAKYGAADCDALDSSCKARPVSEIGCYQSGYCKAKENACMSISGALSE